MMCGGSRTLVAGALLCLAGMSCGRLMSSKVRIENQSSGELTQIRVQFPGKTVAVNVIGQNEIAKVSGSAARDGVIVLEYVRAKRQFRNELTYVAPPIGVTCEVVVLDENITKRCKTS